MARKRKRAGGGGLDNVAMPSLNSLMDVVTIILVYFVKTFAVSPVTVQDPSVNLPFSTSLEAPQDAVVVMITGAQRREVGPNGKAILVEDIPTITVDDELVTQLSREFKIPSNILERDSIIRPLKQKLLEKKKMQNITAELTAKESSGDKLIIVADREVPFGTLWRVLVTSGMAGFSAFQFAIVKLSD